MGGKAFPVQPDNAVFFPAHMIQFAQRNAYAIAGHDVSSKFRVFDDGQAHNGTDGKPQMQGQFQTADDCIGHNGTRLSAGTFRGGNHEDRMGESAEIRLYPRDLFLVTPCIDGSALHGRAIPQHQGAVRVRGQQTIFLSGREEVRAATVRAVILPLPDTLQLFLNSSEHFLNGFVGQLDLHGSPAARHFLNAV